MTASSASETILFVDDEQNILDALRRQLRGKYEVDTALGADAALKKLTGDRPVAVVVSDMRMPGMDGAAFLTKVRECAPDAIRLMLTGNADQDSAVRAVNEGNIFRFLNKPCSTEALVDALESALVQHRILLAEKELLQSTLSGSVKLLTEILSFTLPEHFGKAVKLRQTIQQIAPAIGIPGYWEVEMAGMLANIGYVTVPPTVLQKVRTKEKLSPEERDVIERVPQIGSSLIANIPRLKGVAEIVLFHRKHFDGTGFPAEDRKGEELPYGARVLNICRDMLDLEASGLNRVAALNEMKQRSGWYDPRILVSLINFYSQPARVSTSADAKRYQVAVHELVAGQTVLANIETKGGVLVVPAGSMITETLIERLSNYKQFVGLKEPIEVDCLNPEEAVPQ